MNTSLTVESRVSFTLNFSFSKITHFVQLIAIVSGYNTINTEINDFTSWLPMMYVYLNIEP